MANQQKKKNPPETIKKTLKELHEDLKNIAIQHRDAVLQALELKSTVSFYDIIEGRKKLSPPEKKVIAEIYDTKESEIDWLDADKVIA